MTSKQSKFAMKKPSHLQHSQDRYLATVILSLISFALISLNWTPANILVSAQAGGSQTCHLRELDLCAATLLVFTQSPGGLAQNEQDLNKQCVHMRDADTCFRNYTRRCMTPVQRELVTFAANSTRQLMNEYCTRNSTLRQGYLKHAQCLNQVQKAEQKNCIKDLQASVEIFSLPESQLQKTHQGKRLQLACCTYKRFESCLGGPLEKKCGREALHFVNQLIRRATSRLPETMCRAYRHDNNECKNLLPKPGTQPKGSKSGSILSRLLSAYSGL